MNRRGFLATIIGGLAAVAARALPFRLSPELKVETEVYGRPIPYVVGVSDSIDVDLTGFAKYMATGIDYEQVAMRLTPNPRALVGGCLTRWPDGRIHRYLPPEVWNALPQAWRVGEVGGPPWTPRECPRELSLNEKAFLATPGIEIIAL